jgi:hypothetical protein
MIPVAVERVMSITLAEFLRLLPLVIEADGLIEKSPHGVNLTDKGQLVRISLSEEADTVIASLRLPRLRVRIELSPHPFAVNEFMLRFDRAFQRGGG